MADDTSHDEKLQNAFVRWLVPILLSIIAALLSGMAILIGLTYNNLRSDILNAVKVINETRQEDLKQISQRLLEQTDFATSVRNEQATGTTRLAMLETNAARDREWIREADNTLRHLENGQATTNAELRLIRTALLRHPERDRDDEKPAPPADLGRVPMLWHF